MTNSISNRQMVFIIYLTLTSFSTIELPKVLAQTAGRSGWITILIMAMIYAVAAVIIAKLNNTFPGKAIFDYSRELLGKFVSYLIALYYFLVALTISIYHNLKLVNLLTANFLPQTPKFVLLLFGIVLFGYVAYKGITNIARMFEFLGVMLLIVTVTICVFMIFQGMEENAMPFFKKSDMEGLLPAMKNLVIPFTGMGFLLVVPFTIKNKKAPKVAFFTVLALGLLYVLIVESTIMILGLTNTATFNDAFIEAIKMVEFPVIERTDILYLTFGLSSLFAGTIAIYTSAVEFACRLFPPLKRHVIVIAIGVLQLVLCLFGMKITNASDLYGSIAPYFLVTTSAIIPAILLVIAKAKKRAGSK